jgi:hypothetical protein
MGAEVFQGAAVILGDAPVDAAAAVVAEVDRCASADERRQAWLRAMAPDATPVA